MKKGFLTSCLLLFFGSLFASVDSVRFEIHSGTLVLSGGNTIPYKTFSTSSQFQNNSSIFVWNQFDTVFLTIVNSDVDVHGFHFDAHLQISSIQAGDSVTQSVVLHSSGVFRYFDPINTPYNAYLGLAGIIHVKAPADTLPYFYWDIREHDATWNTQIVTGFQPPLNTYSPKEFMINGRFNPSINSDSIARVTGITGEELRIVIVNNGLSIHSMHFHGYHLEILEDSKNPTSVGRSKDTFPIYPSESLVLSCIPDKPGEYPVHDHNLVAVTGNSVYANGMFLTLLIAP